MNSPTYLNPGATGGMGPAQCERLFGQKPSLLIGGRVPIDRIDRFLLDRGFQVLPTAYPEDQDVLDSDALRIARLRRRFICGDHRDVVSPQGAMASGRRAAMEVAEAAG